MNANGHHNNFSSNFCSLSPFLENGSPNPHRPGKYLASFFFSTFSPYPPFQLPRSLYMPLPIPAPSLLRLNVSSVQGVLQRLLDSSSAFGCLEPPPHKEFPSLFSSYLRCLFFFSLLSVSFSDFGIHTSVENSLFRVSRSLGLA